MPPKKRFKPVDDPKQATMAMFLTKENDHKAGNKNVSYDENNNMVDLDENQQGENDGDFFFTATPLRIDVDTNNPTLTTSHSKHCIPIKNSCWDRWQKLWPWLYEENGLMFCRSCVDAGKTNTLTQGNTTYKTSTFTRHEKTEDHIMCTSSAPLRMDFEKAVEQVYSDQEKAVMKVIKVITWLAKENMPLSKYESLRGLLSDLDVPHLKVLEMTDKISYDSSYSANEILDAISDYLNNKLNEKITASPFISILADESTDIANKKRMTLNAIIIDASTAQAETLFLRNIEYEDGTGVGLASVIIDECSKRQIPMEKMIGFGSDGASVMTGADKGVKGILLRKQPHLIHVHCMAHRLALCTSQAADGVSQIKEYQRWLTNLFYYFKTSGTREQELHKVQAVLEHPVLKYKEIHAVRWLSCYEAVEAVFRTMDPLLSYLHQREAAKDPKSKGLLKQMATTEFVYITYLLMDVLPIVSKLCLKFQERNLDIGQAKVALNSCMSDLKALRNGSQMFNTHLEHFPIDITEKDGRNEFHGHVLQAKATNLPGIKDRFIDNLLTNIEKRFPQKKLIDAFFILGMRTINFQSDPQTPDYGTEEVEVLLDHFGEEKTHADVTVPPIVNKTEVRKEWKLAKEIVRSLKYPVDSFKSLWSLLSQFHSEEIPSLLKLAQIAAVLPLHTADCERVFSQQNKIITKHRCRLSATHLDNLLRIRLDDSEIDVATVLDYWRRKRRRLILKK